MLKSRIRYENEEIKLDHQIKIARTTRLYHVNCQRYCCEMQSKQKQMPARASAEEHLIIANMRREATVTLPEQQQHAT